MTAPFKCNTTLWNELIDSSLIKPSAEVQFPVPPSALQQWYTTATRDELSCLFLEYLLAGREPPAFFFTEQVAQKVCPYFQSFYYEPFKLLMKFVTYSLPMSLTFVQFQYVHRLFQNSEFKYTMPMLQVPPEYWYMYKMMQIEVPYPVYRPPSKRVVKPGYLFNWAVAMIKPCPKLLELDIVLDNSYWPKISNFSEVHPRNALHFKLSYTDFVLPYDVYESYPRYWSHFISNPPPYYHSLFMAKICTFTRATLYTRTGEYADRYAVMVSMNYDYIVQRDGSSEFLPALKTFFLTRTQLSYIEKERPYKPDLAACQDPQCCRPRGTYKERVMLHFRGWYSFLEEIRKQDSPENDPKRNPHYCWVSDYSTDSYSSSGSDEEEVRIIPPKREYPVNRTWCVPNDALEEVEVVDLRASEKADRKKNRKKKSTTIPPEESLPATPESLSLVKVEVSMLDEVVKDKIVQDLARLNAELRNPDIEEAPLPTPTKLVEVGVGLTPLFDQVREALPTEEPVAVTMKEFVEESVNVHPTFESDPVLALLKSAKPYQEPTRDTSVLTVSYSNLSNCPRCQIMVTSCKTCKLLDRKMKENLKVAYFDSVLMYMDKRLLKRGSLYLTFEDCYEPPPLHRLYEITQSFMSYDLVPADPLNPKSRTIMLAAHVYEKKPPKPPDKHLFEAFVERLASLNYDLLRKYTETLRYTYPDDPYPDDLFINDVGPSLYKRALGYFHDLKEIPDDNRFYPDRVGLYSFAYQTELFEICRLAESYNYDITHEEYRALLKRLGQTMPGARIAMLMIKYDVTYLSACSMIIEQQSLYRK